MDPVATERLWLTEPRRTTSLSKVVAWQGSHFALDRSLFAPTSHAHRHPQPPDTGTVWIEGEKRRLDRSFVKDGTLWHHLRGAMPDVGDTLQCQLDQDRREQESRAHTAMHVLIAALQRGGGPPMAGEPTVKGGGSFRIDLAAPFVPPKALAAWLAQANSWIAENRKVSVEHVVRGMEKKILDAQSFDPPDPYPGPDTTLDAVRIEGVCAYPCDGTHVGRTADVGVVQIPQAHNAGGHFTLVGRVKQPR